MPLETFEYGSAESLGGDGAIAEYLLAASENGDANHIARALGVVARAACQIFLGIPELHDLLSTGH